ncbi:MAG: maltose/maltodextrin ABC transporter substrate-binding protein MalE [Succinivibrionaceae bacterium]|nr:maltose/maltodextrin ABC transporter substrate-binding protein MalE [Succinivibrionaceae bacterium]
MRLHDALRKAVREYGVRVIAEKRLLYILSDFRAFEEYPAMRQVLGSIAEEEYGKELVRLFLDDETDWCLSYAQNLRKSLSEKKRFREDLATYAVDSILFGLGLVNSVTEPSEHGFDPIDHSGAAGNGGVGTGARQPGAPQTGGAQAPGSAGQGSGSAPGGGAAPAGNAGANGQSFRMKWLAAAVLLAGGFAFGWAVNNQSGQQNPSSSPQAAGSVSGRTAVQGKTGIQSGDAARHSAEAGQHGKNSSSQLSDKSLYEPEKAYYFDLQSIKDDPDEVALLRKSAEQGNALAQNNLGVMYAEGKGVSRNDSEAVKWFRKSAEQGNSAGQSNLGEMYRDGLGVTPNDEEAVSWFQRSAEQWDAAGEANLGAMYLKGLGVSQDYGEALKWLKKSADHGNAWGQRALGRMHAEGKGVPQDDAEALKWFRKAADWYRKSADEGNAGAQLALGEMYANGFGVSKDYAEAAKWFRKSAEQGNAVAQRSLGMMYVDGSGVPQNYAEAVKWFMKAAEQGSAVAQTCLGGMYANGRGVSLDYAEAIKWYRKAAEQGDDRGQLYLGQMYANGLGVTQDDAEAVKWFRKSAEQGNAEAQANLGGMYANGRGVYQDYAEAIKWYRKSAEHGNANAEFSIGILYENGLGVNSDNDEALKWYRKAAGHGNKEAKSAVERLEKLISARAKSNATLTVWVAGFWGHNGIAKVGERFTRDTGIKVTVAYPAEVEVKFQQLATIGHGPDIFLWVHDRFGEWAKAGLLAPLTPSAEEMSKFERSAWDAVTIGGKVYGYPMSLEAISLICNRKLVPTAPENWEDFIPLDRKLQKRGARAIYWDYTTPYYTYGLISANGGYAFKKGSDGFYNVRETGAANAGASEGVRFLVDLIRDGHMHKGSDYAVMESEFTSGRLGCILNGPWSWYDYDRSGIDYSVNRLPKLSGKRSRPFVGVHSFVINAASHNKDLAAYFLEDYLLTDEGLSDIHRDKAFVAPALKSFEAQAGRDPRAAVTMENALGGDPFPSVPEMARFWSSFQTALTNATSGRQTVEEALETARRRIEQ